MGSTITNMVGITRAEPGHIYLKMPQVDQGLNTTALIYKNPLLLQDVSVNIIYASSRWIWLTNKI